MRTTWMPHEKHGRLTQQSDLPNGVFAFPKQRKEPLTDERHVRNAVARFDQVTDVSDADRALAFAYFEKAAKYYNVYLSETSWQSSASIRNSTEKRLPPKKRTRRERGELKEAAAKAVETKRESGVLKEEAEKAAATRKHKKRGR